MFRFSFRAAVFLAFLLWGARSLLVFLRAALAVVVAFCGATDLALLAKSVVGVLGTGAVVWLLLNAGGGLLSSVAAAYRRQRARREH
jgi:hypothetical protein